MIDGITYEVVNNIGNVIAVFGVESVAKEYAESKGYTVRNINPDFAPSAIYWCKCNFAGFQEVEIDGVEYRRK